MASTVPREKYHILLNFARYKFRYLRQSVEYNCNQSVLRKVTLSTNANLFLILKIELHFKHISFDCVDFIECCYLGLCANS